MIWLLSRLAYAGFAALACAVVLAAPDRALAQGGSTGGSFGKSDQELSGSIPKQAPAAAAKQASDGQTSKSPTAGAKTFHNPTVNGRRVNWCLYNVLDQRCGQAAATTWCRSKGLSHATDFKWEVMTSAISLGDHGICSSFCGVFTMVTCE